MPKSPVAGHARLKTGDRVAGTPAYQLIVLGKSLAGYVQTKRWRDVTVMIAVGNVPISTFTEITSISKDLARMVEAIYQHL